jgi:hypothetical protein
MGTLRELQSCLSDKIEENLVNNLNIEINRNSANLELLIDNTSSIYLYVKLKDLAS